MNKRLLIICAVLISLFASCQSSDNSKTEQLKNQVEKSNEVSEGIKSGDPIIKEIFSADPSAHVFENKLYIYPSHDIETDIQPNNDGDHYAMEDYHVFSFDKFPNSKCVDLGQVLHVKDVPWAKRQMWAPDCAFKNDTYYLYFPAKDKEDIFRIGVAQSKKPGGPFVAQKDYIKNSFSMDPAVFVDDDKKVYMYFGGIWGGQLEKWQSGSFEKDKKAPSGDEVALSPKIAELNDDMISFKDSPKDVVINDESGKPIVAKNEEKRFFEGAWMHKYNGMYYLSYSTGTTHLIVYATSKSPKGPFTYKGVVLNPVKGWTTHHSIVKVNDKWYLFYHDSKQSGVDHKRNVKFKELTYKEDGSINTIEP